MPKNVNIPQNDKREAQFIPLQSLFDLYSEQVSSTSAYKFYFGGDIVQMKQLIMRKAYNYAEVRLSDFVNHKGEVFSETIHLRVPKRWTSQIPLELLKNSLSVVIADYLQDRPNTAHVFGLDIETVLISHSDYEFWFITLDSPTGPRKEDPFYLLPVQNTVSEEENDEGLQEIKIENLDIDNDSSMEMEIQASETISGKGGDTCADTPSGKNDGLQEIEMGNLYIDEDPSIEMEIQAYEVVSGEGGDLCADTPSENNGVTSEVHNSDGESEWGCEAAAATNLTQADDEVNSDATTHYSGGRNDDLDDVESLPDTIMIAELDEDFIFPDDNAVFAPEIDHLGAAPAIVDINNVVSYIPMEINHSHPIIDDFSSGSRSPSPQLANDVAKIKGNGIFDIFLKL